MTISWDWVLLISILLFLVYAAIAIREEKNAYQDSAKSFIFGPFHLSLPSWWTAKEESTHKVTFHRSDTRYDWQASFEWLASETSDDIKKILIQRFESLNLTFDPEKVETTEPKYLFKSSKLVEDAKEFYRIEGMASQGIEKRVYIDMMLYRPKHIDGYLICESLSSVLNGCVEGPYFEEVLKALSFNKGSLDGSLENCN